MSMQLNESVGKWWIEYSHDGNPRNTKIMKVKDKNEAKMKYDSLSNRYRYVDVFNDDEYVDPIEL